MAEGTGKIIVNRREIKVFPKGTDRYVVNQPLSLLNMIDKYDILINVHGGGTTGHTVTRLGIARAI